MFQLSSIIFIFEFSLRLFCVISELTAEQARKRRHHFAHYDWQSMLFSFKDVLVAMDTLKRKNAPTGASEAAALAGNQINIDVLSWI